MNCSAPMPASMREMSSSAVAVVEHALRLAQRLLDPGLLDVGRRGVVGGGLEVAHEAAERAAQVVRQAVGDGAEIAHQRLDPVEHGVERAGEAVELVAGAAQRDAAVERAGHDAAGGAVDLGDPAADQAREQPAGGERQRRDRRERPEQGAAEGAVEGGARRHVAADEQKLAAGQAQGEGRDVGRPGAVGAVELERGPADVGRHGRRPLRRGCRRCARRPSRRGDRRRRGRAGLARRWSMARASAGAAPRA